MIPRIVTTPIAVTPPGPGRPARRAPQALDPRVIEACLAGPARDRLATGPVLAVTTGQQPGLFTGPLYTVYKALSAIALARRLEREWQMPVVPVFWVAGDDHDFAEANHAWILNGAGEPTQIVLRERAPDAAQQSLWQEPCGPEIAAALERLRAETPNTEFKGGTLQWLEAAYRADASLADAFADALHALLGPRGLVVFRPYHPAAKAAAAPHVVRALRLQLADGLSPVLVDAREGRDRLRPDGGGYVTRRSGERFSVADLERLAQETPEPLSPNVLLRPVVEAALLPTVAYLGGPGELEYLPQAVPIYEALGVTRQTPLPRWSGVVVEPRVDKLMAKHSLTLGDFEGPPGALEAHLVSEALPPEVTAAFADLRHHLEEDYARLARVVTGIDPTLERTTRSARNAGIGATHELEKKLIASLKRSHDALVAQVVRARASIFPAGKPQERVLTLASLLIRHGPELLDGLAAEVARWTDAP